MGIFPIMMNILQFWLIDSIVKSSPAASVALPTVTPRSSADGEHEHEHEPLFRASSDDEDDEGADPRLALVARLLEYQRYKEVAEQLGQRALLGRDVFPARGAAPDPRPESERELDVDLFKLVQAFRDVLRRARPEAAPHAVETERVTVLECMRAVMQRLAERPLLAFEDLFDDEVERHQIGQFVADDLGGAAVAEQVVHAGLGDLVADERKEIGVVGDHADVEAIALVAGAGVGELVQEDPAHAKTKRGCTRSRGTR